MATPLVDCVREKQRAVTSFLCHGENPADIRSTIEKQNEDTRVSRQQVH